MIVVLPDLSMFAGRHATAAKVIKARVLAFVALALGSASAFAAFEESGIPVAVKMLYCDSNPRILAEFADASKNVWYPANLGNQSTAVPYVQCL